MGLKKFRPITPTLRYTTVADFGDHAVEARDALTERCRRPAAATTRATSRALDRAAGTSALPDHRLPARQGRRSRRGRAHRVRPEPLGAHRAAALRRRREALHRGAGRPQGGRRGDVGPGRRDQAGERLPLRQHPARHQRPQRRAVPGQGRPASRAERRHVLPADGARRATTRSCGCRRARCARFHVDCRCVDRPGRQPRPREHRRSARRARPAGWAAAPASAASR